MNWPEAIRKLVESRAFGRCEYCLLEPADAGLPHEIDHVISRKHGGEGNPENLVFACYLCNRYTRKRYRLPSSRNRRTGAIISSPPASLDEAFSHRRSNPRTSDGHRCRHIAIAAPERDGSRSGATIAPELRSLSQGVSEQEATEFEARVVLQLSRPSSAGNLKRPE